MKATDLMLGDWVRHNEKPKKVDVIWHNNQVSLNDPEQEWGSIYTDKFPADEIEPILLTREILINNGLENDWIYDKEEKRPILFASNFKEDDENILEISESETGKIYWSLNCDEYGVLELKYVHVLQHALKLCNIDIEIKL